MFPSFSRGPSAQQSKKLYSRKPARRMALEGLETRLARTGNVAAGVIGPI